MEILIPLLVAILICVAVVGGLIYDLGKKINSPCTSCKIVEEQYEEICNLNNLLADKLKEIERLNNEWKIVGEKVSGIKILLVDERNNWQT